MKDVQDFKKVVQEFAQICSITLKEKSKKKKGR